MRKSDDGGLLYRDYHPRAFGEGALPAKAASNSADGEDPWADWHRWCDERADNRIQLAFDTWLAGVMICTPYSLNTSRMLRCMAEYIAMIVVGSMQCTFNS